MNRRSPQSKNLGNGVRPRPALGVKNPIWRLGALVSLPYSIGKVILVTKPDRSLSLKRTKQGFMRRQGKRFCNRGLRLKTDIDKPTIKSRLEKGTELGDPKLDQE